MKISNMKLSFKSSILFAAISLTVYLLLCLPRQLFGFTLSDYYGLWGFYAKDANSETREHVEVYTRQNIYHCVKAALGWTVTSEVNIIGKIPLIFDRQLPECHGVEPLIGREEYLGSHTADNNDYFSDPYFAVNADIIKNMPKKGEDGKIRTYNRERLPQYEGYYDEPYPGQQWTLTQDTATVSGYRCQKATCSYHGRDFEAWFTTEVPVKFGPWKFGGLPGLIVKVYDTDHLYTFECTNVERVRRPMVRSQYARRKPIKRETVLKLERKINENPAKTLGWKDMDGNALSKVYPYEPLELE